MLCLLILMFRLHLSKFVSCKFTPPSIEYDNWIVLNETSNKLPDEKLVPQKRSEDEVPDLFQALKQTYQASTGYGAPQECYVETGCSSSCGDGFRLLLPNKEASSCLSSVLQVLPCNERACPVDCTWDVWSSWTQCAQRTKRKTRSLARIFKDDSLFQEDFNYVSEESYESTAKKRQAGYGAPLSGTNFPSCSQTRVRGVRRESKNGGRECRGERFEERYCRSTQCRGEM